MRGLRDGDFCSGIDSRALNPKPETPKQGFGSKGFVGKGAWVVQQSRRTGPD